MIPKYCRHRGAEGSDHHTSSSDPVARAEEHTVDGESERVERLGPDDERPNGAGCRPDGRFGRENRAERRPRGAERRARRGPDDKPVHRSGTEDRARAAPAGLGARQGAGKQGLAGDGDRVREERRGERELQQDLVRLRSEVNNSL